MEQVVEGRGRKKERKEDLSLYLFSLVAFLIGSSGVVMFFRFFYPLLHIVWTRKADSFIFIYINIIQKGKRYHSIWHTSPPYDIWLIWLLLTHFSFVLFIWWFFWGYKICLMFCCYSYCYFFFHFWICSYGGCIMYVFVFQ